MAIEKVINIVVTQQGTEKAIQQTTKLNSSLKTLEKTTSQVTTGLKDSGNAILENGGAMGILNDLTGGYAMTVKDAVEATGLFSKGTTIQTTLQKAYTLAVGSTTGALKVLRLALIATGLGALVVAIGYIVSKMGEWTEATEEQKREQEALNVVLKESNRLYKESISSIADVSKEQVLRAKIAGKSQSEIDKIEKEADKERYQNYVNERERLYGLLNDKKLTAEQAEEINKQITENQKEYFNSLKQQRVSDLEDELSGVEKRRQARADALQKQREDEARRREEQRKKEEEFQISLNQGLAEFDNARIEAKIQMELDELERFEATKEHIRQLEEQELKEFQEREAKKLLFTEITEKSKLDIYNNTQALLSQVLKKGSSIAKAFAIADIIRGQVSSVSKTISSTVEANAKAVALSPLTGGQPFVTLNTISAGIGIASSIAGAVRAIKDVNSESKSASGGSVPSASGGGASAPSFNLVQGTGSNQIAEGLGAQRRPIRAFVVSSEQQTAEALDRNIVDGASFG